MLLSIRVTSMPVFRLGYPEFISVFTPKGLFVPFFSFEYGIDVTTLICHFTTS